MILRLVVLFSIFIVSHVSAALPPVVFNTVSSLNGLPQNSGRALLQDKNGFVWIGTEDGLVRFDGKSILQFRKNHDDPHSISDNYIGSLAEDAYGRVWVGTMGGGLNVIDKQRETVIRIKNLSSADIRYLSYNNSTKKLWVATGNGLFVIDTDVEKLKQPFDKLSSPIEIPIDQPPILAPNGEQFEGTVSGVVADGGDVWICTRGSGFLRFKHKKDQTFWFPKGQRGLEDDTFNTIFQDRDGDIWLGSQNRGLVKVIQNDSKLHFKHYHTNNSLIFANDVMALADADDGKLWVGTWNGGLSLFEKDLGIIDSYKYQHDDQFSLPSDIILDIIHTKNGQVWLGTFDKGVSWFHPDAPFHTYRKNPLVVNGLKSNIIWSFAAQGNEALWVGTNRGLSKLDLASHQYNLPNFLASNDLWGRIQKDDIRALHLDGKNLWIAGRKQGVYRLSLDDESLIPLTKIAASNQKLTHPYIRLIYKDSKNALWLGATKGLNRLDLTTGKIRNYMADELDSLSLPHYRIRSLFEDSKGQMWVGTSYGLLLLDFDGNPLNVFKPGENEDSGLYLAGNGVRGIGEDDLGRLWFATEGGISIYDSTKKETIILRERDGLPSNATYCALWVDGYIWVTTLNGLARIDSETFQIETYTTDDGLPDNEFNFNAWHQFHDKRLALGTLSGFAIFSPDKLPGPEKSEPPPPLYLQPYKYENEVRLPIDLTEREIVKLDWEHRKITFAYGALDYQKPSSVIYEFKLAGVSDMWTKADSPRLVTFNRLSAGDYSFSVRAKNSHGLWTTESKPVKFTISQVPWKTTTAYFGYLILFCTTLVFGIFLYNRSLRERSVYLEQIVNQRTEELQVSNNRLKEQHLKLDQLLTSRERLFKAIAHELRTPLAVIMSSVESLIEKDQNPNYVLRIIHNRANKMGNLINNLLELASKKSDLSTVEQPFLIKPAIKEAIASFRPRISKQERLLEESIEIDRECLSMNRWTFIMIVSNLLSNAYKFTDERGRIIISCSCTEEALVICVEDDGIGVSEGAEEHIFDWFGRANSNPEIEGWGIGLAFIKDEIEAAGGKIELIQDGTRGAKFVATFRLQSVAEEKIPLLDENLSGSNLESEYSVFSKLEKNYSILIIEDDSDLRSHLSTLFPANWRKLTASDAESGIAMAMKEEPDIIITDLMLPGESGFDVTKKLKEDSKTHHIPIIILTALESEENRLTGLGLSADSFLGKPFSNRELLLRVSGLLSNRERMLARAKQIILNTPPNSVDIRKQSLNSPESEFLAKLNDKLGEDRVVSLMSLDEASKKLAMSKRSLQREMERVGISWREYKLFRRMRYAMDLLVDKKRQVGDVAELTGYSSMAHFSKTFKDITGKSPSEWRRTIV